MKPLPPAQDPRPFDVVGLGGNAADFLVTVPRHPQPDEKLAFGRFSRQGGGRAATTMVTAARLGLRAAYLGGIGDDREGEESLRELRAEGVDVGGVLVRPGAMTQRAFIFINEPTGERTVLWGRSPEIPLRADEIDPGRVRSGRLFYTDAHLPSASVRAARIARGAGIPVLVDLESMRPGTSALLPWIDYLVCSSAFPTLATGVDDLEKAVEALEELSEGAVVVVTRGAEGAVARIDGRLASFPGYQVNVVDTTGAGDVFHGAFAAAILRGAGLGEAIDFSNAAAACKCRSLGARDGIPRGTEVVDALRKDAHERNAELP